MRRQLRRAAAATVATAAAVALAAGMTGPASAKPEGRAPAAAAAASVAGRHHVTLITGDRITLDAKGRVVGLERAAGRDHIPFQIRKAGGHTLVVPGDALRLVASGTLDRRLFDVTELDKAATRKAQRDGLKVIVGYRGAAGTARAEVRDAGTLRHSLRTLDADAVQTPVKDAPELWDAVTDGDRAASGIAHVWLDGVRKANLDKSVPQIGAPKAWAAGYNGKGVKIAVLDTGVDTTHPDLKDQVIGSRNFTTAADAFDHFGHGTHVASIAAGTGARSHGTYTGVAPGAKILNGKVLDDTGSGDDSGILAGMEWAAAQGADVVNLSLGGYDTPQTDPLEAEVNKLSAEKGILFAIAAGNEGPESVGSPGSAAAALTVGAVDGADRLADFSSTGPTAEGTIKPDVTAPGVDITAAAAKGSVIDREVGENPPGYLTISGTSMATPHVAGAAAILKQEHPDWGYQQLKAALTGSAKGGRYTPFEQGAGRIQVDRAVKQTVVADPVSVDFGVQQWPHSDDTPVTRQLTYRNLGTKDVTLGLSVSGAGPRGAAAPAGFFKLGADKVTVPAGSTAAVGVTVDTRLGGTLDGAYSAYVTATGDGQSVRTAAAVQREVQSYSVTLRHIGRDGTPAGVYSTDLVGSSGLGEGRDYAVPADASGTVTIRVPKGTYLLDALIAKDLTTFEGGVDWLVQPELSVTRNLTLTLDARTTRAADITVPDARAKPGFATIDYMYDPVGVGFGIGLDAFDKIRMAPLGGEVASGLFQTWSGQFTKGAGEEYDVATSARVKRIQGDKVRHFKAGEFATVVNSLGAAASGKTGAVSPWGIVGEDMVMGGYTEQKLPGSRTVHVSTVDGARWGFDFAQFSGHDAQGLPVADAFYTSDPQPYKAGRSYRNTFNRAVFGPHLTAEFGLYRYGNQISGVVPLFSDSGTHAGSSDFLSVNTTLYRNGAKAGSNKDPLFGDGVFTVPSADAEYRLTTSVIRSVKVAAASTRIDASWTFRSKKATGPAPVLLPASTVRFGAATGSDSRVAAGSTVSFPVTVEGAAAGRNLKSLAVYVSYDYGRNWKKLTVVHGRITVKNPAKGKAVSFHAKIADKKGNKSTLSVYNAYYAK